MIPKRMMSSYFGDDATLQHYLDYALEVEAWQIEHNCFYPGSRMREFLRIAKKYTKKREERDADTHKRNQ